MLNCSRKQTRRIRVGDYQLSRTGLQTHCGCGGCDGTSCDAAFKAQLAAGVRRLKNR